jgi:class 3 adenylate cyclase
MVREQRRVSAILDADVVGHSRPKAPVDTTAHKDWLVRLAEHRVTRLEPALARHGGRLVTLTIDGVRAEFPSAAAALGAAIEFQQAMADANRGQNEGSAVVFRLGLHHGDARRLETQARGGSIVVSPTVRDAVAGQVRASFAELGGAGLGTSEQPVRAYEVGWDPADWPAASAATAIRIAARGDARRRSRPALSIIVASLAAIAVYLAAVPEPPLAVAGLGVPSVEARAVAVAHGQQDQMRGGAEQDEPDDEPTKIDSAQPTDVYDGLYTGMTTMRSDGRAVTFRVKVTNGIGSGTQSRLDCGMAPVSLTILASGEVSGIVQIFSSTCLKTNLAIRGRAVSGTLLLRLGSQYLELSQRSD